MTRATIILLAATFGVLATASIVGAFLSRKMRSPAQRATLENLNARTRAWWVMAAVFALAIAGGLVGVVLLFAAMSFLTLREVLTLTPTRRGDHRAMFWAFFGSIPLQYVLILRNWYGLFVVLIPVYGFLFLAIRSALAGDTSRYLERVAKIYWGVMICVYCLSHGAALMLIELPAHDGARRAGQWGVLVFLVVVVQMSDVLQYVWGKLLGRRKVVPKLSPSKTWEGLIGGILSASLLGMALTPLTPFRVGQAWGIALLIGVMGFFGGIVASAIKRDAGVKDYGQLIEGHGGMMDRVDSLAFAAPVFFHVVRYGWGG